jgi:hypothetical protein
MGVKEITDRWEQAARRMRDEDAAITGKAVMFAKQYSSEAFYAFDDPLEAALFSVLISMCREQGPSATQGPAWDASNPFEEGAGEP